jgi:hypothetical protein
MTSPAEPPPFEDHVKEVLQRIRNSLAELLSSVGIDPTRPQDAARQLGLNKNLAWKVCRVIRENDPAGAIPIMPGREGFKIFLHAAQKRGAPSAALAAARDALVEFDQMIDIHSGDRDTLRLMIGGLGSEGDGQRAEALRKLSFRGNSATWGVQARIQLCVNVIAPSGDPEWADLAWLSGLIDLRRLRDDVAWTIASARRADDAGTALPVRIEPLDPDDSGNDAVPLLRPFCSPPLPEMRLERGPDGLLRYQLLEGPIGKTAATTCVIGIVGRRFVRRRRTEGDSIGEHNARLCTPVELLIHDLFVHRELSYAMAPEALLYSQLPNIPSYPEGGRGCGLLPLSEKVLDLGAGPPDVLTPELPSYARMIETVFDRLAWRPRDFHGFRLRMRYPPIPTLAVLRYELPG